MRFLQAWCMLLAVSTCCLGQVTNPGKTLTDTIPESSLPIGVGQPGQVAPDTVSFISKDTHDPRKATFYSMVLPGLGQAYNGDYWHIPIIYGTGVALGYFANYNHRLWQVNRAALFAVQQQLPENNPLGEINGGDNEQRLLRRVQIYRRNRDFMYILLAGLYLANIADANVFAHLREFDVNPELSMKIEPSFAYPLSASGNAAPGVSLILTF
jgi:hypothetical protein